MTDAGKFSLTRSIIHECPAIGLPQSLTERLGGVAQIVPLKGVSEEMAQFIVAACNAHNDGAAEELQFLRGDLLYWVDRAVDKGNANSDIEDAYVRYEAWLLARSSPAANKYPNTSCSQCGQEFGPGNSGYSACKDHQ